MREWQRDKERGWRLKMWNACEQSWRISRWRSRRRAGKHGESVRACIRCRIRGMRERQRVTWDRERSDRNRESCRRKEIRPPASPSADWFMCFVHSFSRKAGYPAGLDPSLLGVPTLPSRPVRNSHCTKSPSQFVIWIHSQPTKLLFADQIKNAN